MLIVNRFALHTSHRNITYLAVIIRNTDMKTDNLKVGDGGWGLGVKKKDANQPFWPGLTKKAYPTIFIYEKMLIIQFRTIP